MITEFKLSEKEATDAEEFRKLHRHTNTKKGAIGGNISYKFTPTSIGNDISVRCSICGEEKNITDYDCW